MRKQLLKRGAVTLLALALTMETIPMQANAMEIIVTEAEGTAAVPTGTFGDSAGFSWTYLADTKTLQSHSTLSTLLDVDHTSRAREAMIDDESP